VRLIENEFARVLVRRCQSGEKEAFDDLYAYYSFSLRKMISVMVGTAHAEDIMQETFHHPWRYLHTLREPEKFGPWLMSIARNHCKDWLRKQHADEFTELPPDEILQVLTDYSTNGMFGSSIDQTSLKMDLAIAFEQLPDLYRQVLRLHYLVDLPVAHVSRLIGLPVSTIKWRIHRALALCRLQMLERQHSAQLAEVNVQNEQPQDESK